MCGGGIMLQEVVDEYIAGLSGQVVTRVNYASDGAHHIHTNTITAYRTDLYQLGQYLEAQGVRAWLEVTYEQVAAYLLQMRDGSAYRPATVARKISVIKAFFRYLSVSGLIASDPVETFEAPRLPKEEPQTLSAEQMHSLFAQVDPDSYSGIRDLAMLHMLSATGMRASELVALNMDNFDFLRANVTCLRQNVWGGQKRQGVPAMARATIYGGRVLPLTSETLEATRLYLEHTRPFFLRHTGKQDALFLNHYGERLTRQGFWMIVKMYARSAGIAAITPSMLRHSFAFSLLRRDIELHAVQELLGHTHISTTKIYRQFLYTRTFEEDS
jgi:integrase/recombinase XerD